VFTDDSILNRLEKIQVDPVLSKYEKALFAQQVTFFVSYSTKKSLHLLNTNFSLKTKEITTKNRYPI
jgi:hypothetical protein